MSVVEIMDQKICGNSPMVSILMSVYNGESYLRESVESILNQTFHNFEFIVIDDGSVDDSLSILEEYAASDNRIQLSRNSSNIGLTKSLNRGLKIARGRYIARQDADDISVIDRLQKQCDILENKPDVILVAGNIDLIDAKGRVWRKPRRTAAPGLVAWNLHFYNYLGGHGHVMYRRDSIMKIGGYDETRRFSQDYGLWINIVKIGKIEILQDVVLRYRSHEGNITSLHSTAQREYSISASVRALSDLIGEELAIDEVSALRGFCLGSFPPRGKIKSLDRRLRQALHAYQDSEIYCLHSDSYLTLDIKTCIRNQFLSWAKHLLRSCHVLDSAHALFIGLWWGFSLGESARSKSP